MAPAVYGDEPRTAGTTPALAMRALQALGSGNASEPEGEPRPSASRTWTGPPAEFTTPRKLKSRLRETTEK